MNDRALYLAIRLISRLQELEAVLLLEAESSEFERHRHRAEVIASVLGEEEGISDPISVQLVLAAMPIYDLSNPPNKEVVQQFAEFLENQFHISERAKE